MPRWLKAFLRLVGHRHADLAPPPLPAPPPATPQFAAAQLIFQRILDSPGQRVSWTLDLMTDNYYVLEANYHQLKEYLAALTKPDALFGDLATAPNEVIRLLHNFLASATSLGDLTENVVAGAFGATPIRQLYNQRSHRILHDDPLASFMRGLRNYLVHCRLPFPALDLDRPMEGPPIRFSLPVSEFALQRDELLRWSEWRHNAISYLRQCQASISIESVCDEYYDRISALHSSLHLAIREEFAAELAELDQLEEEYQRLMR